MFVQHKQLKNLNLPAGRVARLNSSAYDVQLAFPGFTPQPSSAYLVAISGGARVLVVVGFFLRESRQAIFFIPKQGEVSVEDAEQVFEEGFVFAESMGFVLSETDYHLLSAADQQKLWQSLPICRSLAEQSSASGDGVSAVDPAREKSDGLSAYRKRSLESLGRFLASL